MSRHVRIRCPICGMLSWQSRLDKEWEFQVVIQDTTSKGRGRIRHAYYEPENEDGVWLLKLALIDKLRASADKLEEEVKKDKQVNIAQLRGDKNIGGVYNVLSIKEADFGECTSMVTDDGIVVLSAASSFSPAPVWLLLPKSKSELVSEIRKRRKEAIAKTEAVGEVQDVMVSSEDVVRDVVAPAKVFYYEPVEADGDFEEGDIGIPLYSLSGVSKAQEVSMSNILTNRKNEVASAASKLDEVAYSTSEIEEDGYEFIQQEG